MDVARPSVTGREALSERCNPEYLPHPVLPVGVEYFARSADTKLRISQDFVVLYR
jgi:hypothetical protein